MVRWLLFLGIILLQINGFTQKVLILDSATNRLLDQVYVYSDEPKEYAISNAKGEINFDVFKDAEQVHFMMTGYKTLTKSYKEVQKNDWFVYLVPKYADFNSVVISATRSKQFSKDIPSKISVISKNDISFYAPQTSADLLNNSGEIFIQKSQQAGGSPMIRGFSTNRLLYSVDGVRMNNAIFRSGNIQNIISLDAFTVETAEVFFGPGSVVYGSDAIGGVMSFQTLTPQLSDSDAIVITGNATARFSTANNEQTYHADFNVRGQKWASVTSITYSQFGNLQMGSNGPDEYLTTFYVEHVNDIDQVIQNENSRLQIPTQYSQFNAMQKMRYKPTKHLDFQYGFHFSQTSEYGRYDRLIETLPNQNPRFAVWNYGPQIWMMHHFQMTYLKSNSLFDAVTVRLANQYFKESRIDRRFNHHRLRTQLEQINAYSANIDFEKFHNKHRLHYGFEAVLNDVTSTGTAVDIRNQEAISVPDRYPKSDWRNTAAYISYQYKHSVNLLFQSGLRYSIFNIESNFDRLLQFYPFDFSQIRLSNDAVTGSIGTVYHPSESWRLSANLSTAFRAPNVDDMGKIFNFAQDEIIVPNTNLSAEYAYNAELNISKFWKKLKLDFTGFYTFLDNALVRREFQVNGNDSIIFDGVMSKVFAIQNAAYGTVYGFNAGFELKLLDHFTLISKYNYQLGIEEMENGDLSRSRHAAPAFGITKLTYRNKDFKSQFFVMYSATINAENLNQEEQQKPFIYAKDENGNPYSPGWYTLNLRSSYEVNRFFTATFTIENFLNRKYRPYSSGLVAPGRNFMLTLRTVF
jgi:hemoglobin/transferrin/lactoferrin receptor protein